MRNVANTFKSDIRTYGRQFDFIVKVNGTNVDSDNFNYVKPSFHSSLFRTIMHELEIDCKNRIREKSKINIEAGVKLNENNYEYIGYNTYTVKSYERQESTQSYIIKAYDKMVESMVDYDLELTEKMTLREYLVKVCKRLDWNTKNIPTSFINSSQLIDPNLHRGIQYTFRDVLDEIATLACCFIVFLDDELYLLYPLETNEEIDETYLNEDSVSVGERYFINSLVFSRAEESDSIYRKDDDSIEINGLHEYKISDNQLLSTNDRDLYIDAMFEYLKNFTFFICDIKSKGILFLEACDRFSLKLGGNSYSTILLNDEVAFKDGLTEDFYVDEPAETETDYKYADETDKKINQTYILVNKQEQKITQLASNQSDYEERMTKQEQDIEGIEQQVKKIAYYERNVEDITQIHITDAGPQDILGLEIEGNITYENYLFPSNDLYPSDGLYPGMEGSELI